MKVHTLFFSLFAGLIACKGGAPQSQLQAAAVEPQSRPAQRAASPGKPSAPVSVQLQPHADTVPGVAADLVLELTPGRALDRMSVAISGTEGLALAPLQLDLGPLVAGTTLRQNLQVTRNSASPTYVRVLIETWQGEAKQAKAVLLPVRGSEVAAEKSTAPPQLGPDGEAVRSLPAEESN